MSLEASAIAFPSAPGARVSASRALLVAATCAALALVALAPSDVRPDVVEPDLALVLRWMAAIKGGMAGLALAACFWRLARPAASWRLAAYLVGPPLMAAGSLALWRLQALGLAAAGLHLGLFALLLAAATDVHFIPASLRRHRRRDDSAGRSPVGAS
jgi:hypothetical protein